MVYLRYFLLLVVLLLSDAGYGKSPPRGFFLGYTGGQYTPSGLRLGGINGLYLSLRTSDIMPLTCQTEYSQNQGVVAPQTHDLEQTGRHRYSRQELHLGLNKIFGVDDDGNYGIGFYAGLGVVSAEYFYEHENTTAIYWIADDYYRITGISDESGLAIKLRKVVFGGGISILQNMDLDSFQITPNPAKTKNMNFTIFLGLKL